MAQRISRAKQQIRAAGARFTPPDAADRDQRIRAVQQVLYLIFNEGYTASAGQQLQRTDLTAEGLRLARMLRGLLPGDAETAGLLALMLLTDARRAARATPGRRSRPAHRAGPAPLGPAADRRRHRPGRADPRHEPGARPVPAAGRDRRRARRGGQRRGHRLDRDPRAVRAACQGLAWTHGHAWAGPSRSRWCTARKRGSPRPMSSPGRSASTIGTTPSAATCTRWPATVTAAAADYRTAARYATNIPERRYLERRLAGLVKPDIR